RPEQATNDVAMIRDHVTWLLQNLLCLKRFHRVYPYLFLSLCLYPSSFVKLSRPGYERSRVSALTVKMPKLSIAKLERHRYSAADCLRQEELDAATYKGYIFGMLFLSVAPMFSTLSGKDRWNQN